MNNKLNIFFILGILLIFSACQRKTGLQTNETGISSSKISFNQIITPVEGVQTLPGECLITRDTKTIQGNSMSPLLHDGEKIDLLTNYYRCGHQPQKGDIIAYDYGGDKYPLIKMLRVNDTDKVEVVDNQLKVNGEILTNSAGAQYQFSKAEINMLKLYIEDQHIPKDSFLIFGDNVSVSTDSRKFGAVSPVDFLGKFERN